MRSTLGRIATLCVAGLTLVAATATGADAAPPPTTAPPTTAPVSAAPAAAVAPTTEAPSTTEPTTTAPTTTQPTTTATTTTTTTTTVPAPLVVELPSAPGAVTPSRGTQKQVTDTLPPPPTTTTTTTLPPEWVLPPDSGAGRRVVYSKSRMRLWTVEADGTVSKTHRVSGRRTFNQPSPGTYAVFSRSSHTCNINNPHICWRNMVRFTKGPSGDNIGFHEIPTDTRTGRKLQSISQLGQALSGGCVRQAPADAQFVWDWAPVGTPVVVLG